MCRGEGGIAQISKHYNRDISSYHWIKWLNLQHISQRGFQLDLYIYGGVRGFLGKKKVKLNNMKVFFRCGDSLGV